MCNKVAYETRAEARGYARALTRQGCKQSYAYRCDFCGLWHLTSMSRQQAKKIVKARRKRARYENA